MNVLVAALPAFLASAVEFVEALTIVLAVGVTRQWRSTLIGVGAAVVVLAAIVGVFGSAIVLLVPISVLRLVVGGFLVIYGLQWLVKAILRAAGAKAKHDEDAIYAAEIAAMRQEPPGRGQRHGLDQLHRRLQGRPPGGHGGGLHRGDLRRVGGPARPGDPGRGAGRAPRRRPWGSPSIGRWRACRRTA